MVSCQPKCGPAIVNLRGRTVDISWRSMNEIISWACRNFFLWCSLFRVVLLTCFVTEVGPVLILDDSHLYFVVYNGGSGVGTGVLNPCAAREKATDSYQWELE